MPILEYDHDANDYKKLLFFSQETHIFLEVISPEFIFFLLSICEDKQEKIKKLLAMQKKFIALDREQGVEASEYFSPDDDSEIAGFREEYRDLAMEIVDLAHKDKGSQK